MADWKNFLEHIKKEPKDFVKAIIENLRPPKYVIEQLKEFEWMCHFCWKPRMDLCCLCQRSICEEHCAKTVVGPKTKLEWYFCPDCVKTSSNEKIMEKVRSEDEEFWLEDQK